MRRIDKTRSVLTDNSGETIVEVTVAFTLLAVMLVIFSQGIAYATAAEVNASRSRNHADAAMIELQRAIARPTSSDLITPPLPIPVDGNNNAYMKIYTVRIGTDTPEDLSDDGTYLYAVYGTDVQSSSGT